MMLRGAAGLCLALPWLESALPRHARAQTMPAPKRLLIWTQPNGTVMDRWVPTAGASEKDFMLSEILKPLQRHQADLVVVQNLMQRATSGHQYVSSLTGWDWIDLGAPKYLSKGVSLDQYVAQQLAGITPLASLELGVCQAEDGQGAVSWSAAGKSVLAEASPFKVYSRLVGGGSSTVADNATAARLLAHRRSVIDTVLDPLSELEKRLGSEDRAAIDNYLDSVRGVEHELTALQARLGSCTMPELGPDPSVPGQAPWWADHANAPALLALQRKLAVTALACDLTRVVTLTVAGSSGGARTFDYIDGVSQRLDWHGFSHEVEKGNDFELTQIEKWYAEQLALLIDDLKAVSEPGGGSLLQNTLVMTNNEYGSNGPVAYLAADPVSGQHVNLTHQPKLMPYLLFGQCGGALQTGRNLVLPFTGGARDPSQGNGYSHTRLLVSVLNALGFEDTSFGDPANAEGGVPGLLT
jgi:hypothetical protein